MMADIGALLGGLNDNVLPLDYEVLGGLIGESVIPGLGGVGLERSDLIIYRNNEGLIDETVLGLVRSGTKILDAMLYVMAGQPDGVRLEGPVAGCNAGLLTENDMAGNVLTGKRNLIWTIAFTLLRGHYPSADGTAIGSDIPAFMHNILGMNVSPAAVAAAVASFTLSKLDMAWMKVFNFNSFPEKIKNRLALGMPGYRYLSVFKYIPISQPLGEELARRVNLVRELNTYPADWDMFPPTRSQLIIERLGSVNHLVGNLISQVYTRAEIAGMVRIKMLPVFPEFSPTHDRWEGFQNVQELGLVTPIFGRARADAVVIERVVAVVNGLIPLNILAPGDHRNVPDEDDEEARADPLGILFGGDQL